ncbi:MAG: hypothetical protein ACPLZD_02450 [Candidatus Saccharicenans sp.]
MEKEKLEKMKLNLELSVEFSGGYMIECPKMRIDEGTKTSLMKSCFVEKEMGTKIGNLKRQDMSFFSNGEGFYIANLFYINKIQI